MTSDIRLQLDARAVLSEFQDGAVLLDLKTKRYLVLNPTAGTVCRALSSGASVPDLVAALCRTYQVSREDAERDVRALLDELKSDGLLCQT